MSVAANTIKHMSDANLIDDQKLNTDPIPVEQLEARICELAGHLTAATCRFLELVADFDARQGWASWEMPSCAAWLSWKCQIAPGPAREHVRVARALPDLPLIRAEFAAARLSYAKVRALTRIATADNEEDLAQMAIPMTAGQLERFARAHRRVTDADGARARSRRQLRWGWVDDHEFSFRGQLPPEQAAVVLQALRAAMDDLEHPHDDHGDVPAETRAEALARRDQREYLPGHHPRRDRRRHRRAGARRRSRGNAEGARRPGRDRPAADLPREPPPPGHSAATSKTAPRSARPPCRRSRATPPSAPCCTTPTAPSSTPAGAPASRPQRYGARSGSGTGTAAATPAASPAGSTPTTSGSGPTAARPGRRPGRHHRMPRGRDHRDHHRLAPLRRPPGPQHGRLGRPHQRRDPRQATPAGGASGPDPGRLRVVYRIETVTGASLPVSWVT